MRIIKVVLISFLFTVAVMSQAFLGLHVAAGQPEKTLTTPAKTPVDTRKHILDEILIKVGQNSSIDQIHAMNKAHGMTILEKNPVLGIYRLKVSKPLEASLAYAESQPFVKYVSLNYVLAEMRGKAITLADVERFIGLLPPLYQRQYGGGKAKKLLLNSLIDNRIFAKAAQDEDFDKNPEVRNQLDISIEKTLSYLYKKELEESFSVNEKDLRDYYESHQEEFKSPEKIKVRYIVARTEDKARELLEKIKPGKEFEKVAVESSTDTTWEEGVELGWITRGSIGPAFERAAFALKRGEISNVTKTRFGYNIIKVEDRKDPEQQSFEEALTRVEQVVRRKKQMEIIENKKEELMGRYGVIIHDDLFSEITGSEAGKMKQKDMMQKLKDEIEMRRKQN
jgi:peptidyl-prolyl cis-trans isomerase C